MVNRIQSRQSVVYELTKEAIEEIILPALINGDDSLPFVPNKIAVNYSDPANGIYQVRIEYDEDLPQVMPLREPRVVPELPQA